MAIKRYYAEADNTITNAYDTVLSARGTGSNAGANDILEVFSIYGQYSTSSSELSRVLIKFPVTGTAGIKADRTATTIPASGSSSLKFYLRLFNARHDEQLPENLTLSIFPVARAWEEGTGLDLVNHGDKTKDAIPGSNWDNRTKGVAWTRDGGDYISGSQNSAAWYTASFVTGSEDLEVDVTDLVEEWISTSTTAATASINVAQGTIAVAGVMDDLAAGQKFVIEDSAGRIVEYVISNTGVAGGKASGTALSNSDTLGGATYTSIAGRSACAVGVNIENPDNQYQILVQLKAAIESDAGHGSGTDTITVSGLPGAADGSAQGMTLTQATATRAGNTGITSGLANVTAASTFTAGVGLDDYGFGIMVTGSQEAYFSSSIGDSGSQVQNTGGITKSMYTKRFFARSSEFFFRRPVIEARWEDRKTDDRNKFYASSSLCSTANTQSLYLYNYVDGQLTSVGETVKCSIYASSGSAPSGSALVTDTSASMVETGIYQAQVVFDNTGSYTTVHDIWAQADDGGDYHTGSITVRTRTSQTTNTQSQYVTTITNLKDSYSRKNTSERMRVFARARNFTPTVYTVANKNIEGETIVSASYSILRTVDGKVLFSHGTGSAPYHTYLSYDTSGSYFDFDMSLLEAGYMYGIQLSYYIAGAWKDQEEIFKFRVED